MRLVKILLSVLLVLASIPGALIILIAIGSYAVADRAIDWLNEWHIA